MKLTEIKTDLCHYWEDENGYKQGEYKDWHFNGQLWEHTLFKDGFRHGERMVWDYDGRLYIHTLYSNGDKLDFDMNELPTNSEELLLFRIRYGNLPLLNSLE